MDTQELREKLQRHVQRWQALNPRQVREFNEENTKNVFIQPLLEALGWDFGDIARVTAEHSTGVGRVDFAFRVNGVSRFYLEAKPLRVSGHPKAAREGHVKTGHLR